MEYSTIKQNEHQWEIIERTSQRNMGFARTEGTARVLAKALTFQEHILAAWDECEDLEQLADRIGSIIENHRSI